MAHSGCLQGTDHKHTQIAVSLPEWGYEKDNGPLVWGDLCKEFSLSKTGLHQSPIDLRTTGESTVQIDTPINFKFHNAPGSLLNNGHTVQLNWQGGDLIFNGKHYSLKQFHFHAPAEHLVNGKRYPMEAHFVHIYKDEILGEKVAVLGVFFDTHIEDKDAEPNKFLEQFFHKLPQVCIESEKSEEHAIDCLSVNELQLDKTHYFHYQGSLTTPPCTEGIEWFVIEKPQSATEEEIQEFIKANHVKSSTCIGNFRPIQPLNTRKIEYYRHRTV